VVFPAQPVEISEGKGNFLVDKLLPESILKMGKYVVYPIFRKFC